MSAPRVLALCAGYGGLETALQWALDARTVVFAEKDPFAAAVFTAHHVGVPNLGDISTLTGSDWQRVRDTFAPDVLAAGFPCQDISNAGKRVGIGGKRSGVWKHVAAAVRVLRPRLVFLENVAAILSRGLDVVAADLAQAGYDARWTCLRAGDPAVGAPHPRDRWFCIAYPAAEDADLAAWRQRWTPAPRQAESRRPRPDAGGRGLLPAPGSTLAGGVRLLPTPAARDWKSGASNLLGTNSRPLNELVVNLLPTPIVADARGTANYRPDGTPYGDGYGMTLTDATRLLPPSPPAPGTGNAPALLPTPKASDGPHGGPNQRDTQGHYYLPGQAVRLDRRWVATDGTDYGPAIHRWEHITGHLAPCPTEPGARGNRRLNPAFAEWMMGLAPGHVTALGLPRKEDLRVIGNGAVSRHAHHAYGLLLGATTAATADTSTEAAA